MAENFSSQLDFDASLGSQVDYKETQFNIQHEGIRIFEKSALSVNDIKNTIDTKAENVGYIFHEFLAIKEENLKSLNKEEVTKYVHQFYENANALKNDMLESNNTVVHFLKLINLNDQTVEVIHNFELECDFIELILIYIHEEFQKEHTSLNLESLKLLALSMKKLQYFDRNYLYAEEKPKVKKRNELGKKVIELFSLVMKNKTVPQEDVIILQETLLVEIIHIVNKGGLWKSREFSLDIKALRRGMLNNDEKISNLSLYIMLYDGENTKIDKKVITTTLQWTDEAMKSSTLKSNNGLDINVLLYGLKFISFQDIDLLDLASKPELVIYFFVKSCALWKQCNKTYQHILSSSLIVLYNQLIKSKRCEDIKDFLPEIETQIIDTKDITLKITAALTAINIFKIRKQTVPEFSDEVLRHIVEWLIEANRNKNNLYKDRFHCTDLRTAMDEITMSPRNKIKLTNILLQLKDDSIIAEFCHKYQIVEELGDSISMVIKDSKDIDLLLLGKTGEGKSSTGNTILGAEYFKASDSCVSVTNEFQSKKMILNGRIIDLVDLPGLEDTENINDVEASTERTVKVMEEAILKHPQGYHAFIIVLRYGTRFRREDKMVIKMLKDIFGDDIVKHFSILLLTHGDVYTSHKENQTKKFRQWCCEQKGVFKELFDECGHRAVLFDNNTKDKGIKEKQIRKLITKVDSLKYSDRRYNDDHFKAAQESRQILIMKQKVERITNEASCETNAILERMKSSSSLPPDKQTMILKDLIDKCQTLMYKINTEDCGKNVFKVAKDLMSSLMDTLSTRYQTALKLDEKNDLEYLKRTFKTRYEEAIKQLHKESKANSFDEKEKLKKEIEETKTIFEDFKHKIANLNKEVEELKSVNESQMKQIEAKHYEMLKELKFENYRLNNELFQKTSTFRRRLKHLINWRELFKF